MKIHKLLLQAGLSADEERSKQFTCDFIDAFTENTHLSALTLLNTETHEDSGSLYVSFELNRLISSQFITMIRPEIRDGDLSVAVVTNRMLDSKGLSSRSWEVVDGLDDVVVSEGFDDTAEMSERLADIAKRHHRELLASVGVPLELSEKLSQQAWTGVVTPD